MRKRLVGCVLLLATGTMCASSLAHAGDAFSDAMLGNWCWSTENDEADFASNKRIWVRYESKECYHGPHNWLVVEQDGIDVTETGRCKFEKVEQTGPQSFLVYDHCEEEGSGGTQTYEIVDGKLVITFMPEG
jgi:hypothetical protein